MTFCIMQQVEKQSTLKSKSSDYKLDNFSLHIKANILLKSLYVTFYMKKFPNTGKNFETHLHPLSLILVLVLPKAYYEDHSWYLR